ncbi:MAG: hypothetical protein AAFY25_03530 [Pseudomonadota bacterium]
MTPQKRAVGTGFGRVTFALLDTLDRRAQGTQLSGYAREDQRSGQRRQSGIEPQGQWRGHHQPPV